MQLGEHIFHRVGNGQTDVSRVLQQRKALVGEIEGNDRAAQRGALAHDMNIQDIRHATSIRISTFLQMPRKPTAEDSFLSMMAHMRPVM